MKISYVQCVGGVSGDMLLGALVDLGLPTELLCNELSKLGVTGFSLSSQKSQRGGVVGTYVSVNLDDPTEHYKTMTDFIDIVCASKLSSRAISQSCQVFERLGRAEESVHGLDSDQLHLHELGTLDTLVDVVGLVAGLEILEIERLYSSPLPLGSGIIRSQHGPLPVPAPATLKLLEMSKAPVVQPSGCTFDTGEMITPTGTAILTTLAKFSQPPISLEKSGYGLGTRNPSEYPNVLTMLVGEMSDIQVNDIVLLETNIDDMPAESLSYVQERLFELGVRDVWFTSIQMKKNRPGTKMSIVVMPELESKASEVILKETTTLGVRSSTISRYEADRELVELETSLGTVSVKIKKLYGTLVSVSPEYEDCRKIALDRNMPLNEVVQVIQNEAYSKFF